ncbi:MAG: hypothetical protein ACREUW_06110 [Burkholderiales bacterium]
MIGARARAVAVLAALLAAACSGMPSGPPRADMGMVPVERGPREDMRARFDREFKAADKDGDGALTKTEMEAGMPIVAADFAKMDTNGDGKVTREEMQRFLQGRAQ